MVSSRCLVATLLVFASILSAGESELPSHPEIAAIPLLGNQESSNDGQTYLCVDSEGVDLKCPNNLLQLVASPNGAFAYGICKDNAGVLVYELPEFKEIEEIAVPRFPLSLWCDDKHVVIACTSSGAVLDAVTHKLVQTLESQPKPPRSDFNRPGFKFPGVAVGEIPGQHILVSWASSYGLDERDVYHWTVYYTDSFTGKVVRKIKAEVPMINGRPHTYWNVPRSLGDTAGARDTIFVPKHELLISIEPNHPAPDHKRSGIIIRCGPVESSPPAGATEKGGNLPPPAGTTVPADTPPWAIQVGETLSYAPKFSRPGATRVKFKLQKTLEGMSIDSEKGTVTWTPPEAYVGKWDISIVADVDGTDVSVLKWTLEVKAVKGHDD